MRDLKRIAPKPDSNNRVHIPVPIGREVRLLGVQFNLVAPSGYGEAGIELGQKGDAWFDSMTTDVLTDPTIVQAMLGGSQVQPILSSENLATGEMNYATRTYAQIALPDVWWPFEFDVTLRLGGGSTTSVVVIYEERDI